MDEVLELYRIARELMYPAPDGGPVYIDDLTRLDAEVTARADALLSVEGETPEEEARICLALLMGYGAALSDSGDKNSKKQTVLNRSCRVLNTLPASLLKCQLLTYCYGEVYIEELAEEALGIIRSWNPGELNEERREISDLLKDMIEYPYPNSDSE